MSPATFASKHPLPEGWSSPTFVQDTIVADGLELARCGVVAMSPRGEEITGSAADVGTTSSHRGYYELLERVATVAAAGEGRSRWDLCDRAGTLRDHLAGEELFPSSVAPSRWRFARSNGVALHATWEQACDRAYWELVERDRILRSWYGEISPSVLLDDWGKQSLRRLASYDVRAYAFPGRAGGWGEEISVAGVFAFPTAEGHPFFCGFAARPSLVDAANAAEGEALQQLAFLWGEEIPRSFPPSAPFPLAHLERSLFPAHQVRIRRWLGGGHVQFDREPETRGQPSGTTLFVDLTPAWLGDLRVAKAISAAATPLTFGEGPFGEHLPAELRLHPIA
ncbi:MAG: hypothetical protein HOW73_08555 [Polyangiaceae bacterium]|nr:hypothetical protein [Polyangiaceae bacterium]